MGLFVRLLKAVLKPGNYLLGIIRLHEPGIEVDLEARTEFEAKEQRMLDFIPDISSSKIIEQSLNIVVNIFLNQVFLSFTLLFNKILLQG